MKQSVLLQQVKEFIVVLFLLFLEYVFFRNILFNDNLFADASDGRLTTLLVEHWFRFFSGKESFSDLLIFHPVKGTAAYTDLFLPFGIIHSLFRFFGVSIYQSYKNTLILVHLFGMFTMYYLLAKKIKLPTVWSVFGTIAFSHAPALGFIAILHTQLLGVCFLPVLAVFFVNIMQNFHNKRNRLKNCLLFVFMYAIIAYNSWYIAFFVALFVLVLLCVYLAQVKINGNSPFLLIKQTFAAMRIDFFICFVFSMLIFAPFVCLYLPVLRQSGGYGFGETFSYLPEPIDLINVTSGNLVLGKVLTFLRLFNRGVSFEAWEGFSLVLFIPFLLFLVMGSSIKECKNIYLKIFYRSFLVSVALCLFLVVRLSNNGVSFWYFIWKFVPGGKSVRAAGRFLLFLGFPMSIIVAVYFNSFNKRLSFVKWLVPVPWLALVLAAVFNLNKVGVPSSWNISNQERFVSSVPTPPLDCECFYIVDPNLNHAGGRSTARYQLDAFEIANKFNLKTINGYSGQQPKDWSGIWDVYNPHYQKYINHWIYEHELKNVYCYDLAKSNWERHSNDFSEYVLGNTIFFSGENFNGNLYTNFYEKNASYTWTEGDKFYLQFRIKNSNELTHARALFELERVFNKKQQVGIELNHKQIKNIELFDGDNLEFDFPVPKDGVCTLVLTFPNAISPFAIGESGDSRKLALAIKKVIFVQSEEDIK